MNKNEKKVKNMMKVYNYAVSYALQRGPEIEEALKEVSLSEESYNELLTGLVSSINDEEYCAIVCDLYGLYDGKLKSYEEVGKKFSYTPERTAEREARAFRSFFGAIPFFEAAKNIGLPKAELAIESAKNNMERQSYSKRLR